MSSPGSNPMDAVSALMQERQRYEVWIAALEEKRAITPPHVYERVRGDYEARLREIVQKLVGRTTELKETVAALTARLAKLQAEENAKRDERYEAELRATVGEFDGDKWEKLRKSIDDTVARLASERTGVSTELARVQQILSMAGAAAGAAGGTTAGTPSTPAGAVESTNGSSGPPSAGVSRPGGGRFDELAFLSSVVDTSGRPGAPQPAGSGGGSGKHPTQAPPAPAAVADPAASSASGRQPVQPAPAAPAPRQPTGANQVVTKPENSDGAVPSYLRDVPTETTKTLKCQSCGTMNSPTEWYCERCGGELAAM